MLQPSPQGEHPIASTAPERAPQPRTSAPRQKEGHDCGAAAAAAEGFGTRGANEGAGRRTGCCRSGLRCGALPLMVAPPPPHGAPSCPPPHLFGAPA
jgi:hypothetical protein